MNVDITKKEADLLQQLKLQIAIKYNRKDHKQTKLSRGGLNLQLCRLVGRRGPEHQKEI
jgi:hypothetical protein